MEELLTEFVQGLPIYLLLGLIAVCIAVLGKGADVLVEEAVTLSIRHGISKVIIGATIVSLGTTLPEVTVSVMSAINGKPDMPGERDRVSHLRYGLDPRCSYAVWQSADKPVFDAATGPAMSGVGISHHCVVSALQ